MDNAGSLDFLVKLASFGTAGVCILAIFFIGSAIIKLPNDSPSWKPQLMKRFISACIIIAGITAVSGGLNAYFNRGKTVEAVKKAEVSLDETAAVAKEYEKLSIQYNDLSTKVTSLIEQMEKAKNSDSPQALDETNTAIKQLKVYQPPALNKILDPKSNYMIERSKVPIQQGMQPVNK